MTDRLRPSADINFSMFAINGAVISRGVHGVHGVNTNYTVSRHDATRKPKAHLDEIKRRSQAVPLGLLFRAIKLPTSTGRLPPNRPAWTLSFVIRATSDVQVYRDLSIRVRADRDSQ